jgi:nucleotide-binding universal stress UspA family protein
MTRVLLAVDPSSSVLATDAVIRQFPAALTHVHVLHVVTDRDRLPPAATFAEGPTAACDVLAVEQSARHRGEELVAEAVTRLTAGGFETSSEVRVGDPEQAILECATTSGAEVIVLGSRQLRGADRWLSGSVSAAVVRRAHCPVEVVPCPERSLLH